MSAKLKAAGRAAWPARLFACALMMPAIVSSFIRGCASRSVLRVRELCFGFRACDFVLFLISCRCGKTAGFFHCEICRLSPPTGKSCQFPLSRLHVAQSQRPQLLQMTFELQGSFGGELSQVALEQSSRRAGEGEQHDARV